MALLTAAEQADLRETFLGAWDETSLVLYRDGSATPETAQDVQYAWANRQPQTRAGVNAPSVATDADGTFFKASPFNVQQGDWFEFAGFKGGRIKRVRPERLDIVAADFVIDPGTL